MTYADVVPFSYQHAPGIYYVGQWIRAEEQEFDIEQGAVFDAFAKIRELRGEVGRRAVMNGLPVLIIEDAKTK